MSIIDKFNTFTKIYAENSMFNDNYNTQTGGQETSPNTNTDTTNTETTPKTDTPSNVKPKKQTEFQRRLNDVSDKATYSGASANFLFNLIKLFYEYVILYSLKIINFFYQRLESELKSFAGDADSINGEIDENRRLLKAIELVIQSPEFQEKWNDFTTILADLVGTMVDKIRKELDGEFGEMMSDVTELIYKNTKTAVFGVGLGALDGICALPPMIPICEIMIAVGTGSKLSSETFLTFMRSITRIANSFSKVFGDTSDKLASVIQESLDMYTTVTDLLSNTSNIGVNAINKASTKVESLTPSSPLSNIGSQSGGYKKTPKNKTHKRINIKKRKSQRKTKKSQRNKKTKH